MNKYLVVRITDDSSFFLPKTKSFGEVDLRPGNKDLNHELEALQSSLGAYGLSLNLELCPRLVTIVKANDTEEANIIAELIFEETLDCFDIYSYGLTENSLLPVGYIINLDDYMITSLKPKTRLMSSSIFHIIPEKYPRVEEFQYILSISRNELSESLIRSGHWARKARMESSTQLKFIFRWIALESICKISKEDDIIPKIMLALGFITSKYITQLDYNIIQKLYSDSSYRIYKKWLHKKLKYMKKYRNNTVHKGFRRHEENETELKIFAKIAGLAYPKIRTYIIKAIINDFETLHEFWEIVPLLVEEKPNLIEDVHHTVMPILKDSFAL